LSNSCKIGRKAEEVHGNDRSRGLCHCVEGVRERHRGSRLELVIDFVKDGFCADRAERRKNVAANELGQQHS
jgi:hypothetical protein